MFQGKEWIWGSAFTLVEPYAVVEYSWGVRGKFPVKVISVYTAW